MEMIEIWHDARTYKIDTENLEEEESAATV
jgi:hypothetical protein